MPRHNRATPTPDDDDALARATAMLPRHEQRRGMSWTVQAVSAARAIKPYVCPGCSRAIDAGTAHVVAWRDDALLGDAAALADRRHWHPHCWRIG